MGLRDRTRTLAGRNPERTVMESEMSESRGSSMVSGRSTGLVSGLGSSSPRSQQKVPNAESRNIQSLKRKPLISLQQRRVTAFVLETEEEKLEGSPTNVRFDDPLSNQHRRSQEENDDTSSNKSRPGSDVSGELVEFSIAKVGRCSSEHRANRKLIKLELENLRANSFAPFFNKDSLMKQKSKIVRSSPE